MKHVGTQTGGEDVATQEQLASKSDSTHTHPPSSLTQAGAAVGDALVWDGVDWAPSSPSSDAFEVDGGVAATDYTGTLQIDFGGAV